MGRLREAVCDILVANFPDWFITPDMCHPAQGCWRSDITYDVFRWEVYAYLRKPDGSCNMNSGVHVGCWDTMTSFVRECNKAGGKCHLSDDGYTIYPGLR